MKDMPDDKRELKGQPSDDPWMDVRRHILDGRLEDAHTLWTQLDAARPGDPAADREKAHLAEAEKDLHGAVALMERAIAAGDAQRKSDHFHCGYWCARLADHSSVIRHLTTVVELENEDPEPYYSELALFLRAHAYLSLGRRTEALNDCVRVRPGFKMWLGGRELSVEWLVSSAKQG